MRAPSSRASPRAASPHSDTAETALSRCRFPSAPPECDSGRRGKVGLTLAALIVSCRRKGHDWHE
jgi:hypothetical protein